jgi:poly-gamma-glutamate synthesis protein (capsule biosynthesis protein)
MSAKSALSLFLAGDALIVEPWSRVRDPAFDRLVAEMRAADATLVNLETVIHEFKGHAQADSGGVYAATPPAIASELKWAGVDLVAHANNHAFDYGSIGILETLQHVEAAGLLLAGTGRDLQDARAPRYLACDGGTVALVAMASTFVPYGKASRSRPDLPGRPGLNPLALTRESVVQVTPRMAGVLRRIARFRGKPPDSLKGPSFRLFGRRFQVAETSGRVTGRRAARGDAAANLGAIAEAAGRADLTIASIHAHAQRSWLPRFARDALSAGADVVFCHGPHELRGIELVDGKPILYGLGDFVFQVDRITRHPAEAYERLGLGDEATAAELAQAGGETSPAAKRESYEGCAAALRFADGRVAEIRLLPLDLQFDAPAEARGRPRWADPGLGRRIIERIARRSKRLGTEIRFDSAGNQGFVSFR